MLLVIYYSEKISNLLINLFLSDEKGNRGCIGLGILGTIKFVHVNCWLEKGVSHAEYALACVVDSL